MSMLEEIERMVTQALYEKSRNKPKDKDQMLPSSDNKIPIGELLDQMDAYLEEQVERLKKGKQGEKH